MKYKIVSGDIKAWEKGTLIEELINDLLKKGWTPHGHLHVEHNKGTQVLLFNDDAMTNCPSCGAWVYLNDTYCRECGIQLKEG